jgi:hypothetical protein
MTNLLASVHTVDVILGLIGLECALLAIYRRLTGRGVAMADVAANLLSGACLLLALRGALGGASWTWIAGALSAALLSHLADLRRRWRS